MPGRRGDLMPSSHDDFAHLHQEPTMPTPHAAPPDTGLKAIVKKYRKAIVATLTPLVTLAASKWGLGLSDGECCGIATFLTGALVAIVPNRRERERGTGTGSPSAARRSSAPSSARASSPAAPSSRC
jgi:hypothetical protein